MDENKTRCPKCQHEQDGQIECEACGLIFARYDRFLQKQQEQQEQQELGRAAKEQRKKSTGYLFQVLLLMLLTATATWYFTRSKTSTQKPPTSITPPSIESPTREAAPAAPPKQAPTPIAQSTNHGSSIEHARNATVSIETPWGSGSGFFIKENSIITNRHVVEIDQEELKAFRHKIETGRKLIELEQQKINEMHQKMQEIPQGATRKQLAIITQQHEEELAQHLPQFEQAEKKLKEMERTIQPGDIKIFLADGTEHRASAISTSQNQDLALLSLYTGQQTIIQRQPSKRVLEQGDKVYTIGSPSGLRNTVTAGIFSGYRKREADGAILLQTDAPINPGNSGGPLIDEKGYVRGVNTMILRDTQGIGFAIPIETVYEEFQSALH